jgi:hypothetical protein
LYKISVENPRPDGRIDCKQAICALVKHETYVAIGPHLISRMELMMLNPLKSLLAVATIMSATAAQAGGPVIIEEGNDAVVAAQPASKVGILPIIGLLVVAGLIACGGDDDDDDDRGGTTTTTTTTTATTKTQTTTDPKG